MFNFKIMLRNLRRGGIYSAINIGGLAIGMAAAILILAWIYHEWSYDRFHAKEKQLYVAYNRVTFDDGTTASRSTMAGYIVLLRRPNLWDQLLKPIIRISHE